MSSTPPDYYEEVRQGAAQRWEQLEKDPELAGPWRQLFKQVQIPRHVLSELLQNADDARTTEASVRIENGTFIFEHNGEDFSEEQFASLCRFGYSNKRALHTIGFRGVGFKSTFSLGDPVKLVTPTLSICFYQERFTEPRWLDGQTDTLGRTRVIVKLTDHHRQLEVEKNLDEWRKNPFSLLFFENLRRIRIANKELKWGSLGPGPVANSEWMALNEDVTHDYLLIRSDAESIPDDAMEEIRSERMLETDEERGFPPCEINILLGEKGKLYVVLPTGVDTALPFACNAPFIQAPARLKIKNPETSPTNRWLLERAGKLAASAMLRWLGNTRLPIDERAQAYGLLPDVEREDGSLNGVCGATVERAFEAQVDSQPLLLTHAGKLAAAKRSVAIPRELFDIWPADQIDTFLDARKRPTLSQHIDPADQRKLLDWGLVEEIDKQRFINVLGAKNLPKPEGWRTLLKLWAYVAPKVTGYRRYQSADSAANLRIAPVQGKQVLCAPNQIVRLGKRRLLDSDSDWEFLHRHLIALNPNWPRFLAKRHRNASEQPQSSLSSEVDAAYELLREAGLDKTSDVSTVISKVAKDFFSAKDGRLEDCVRLSHIAAKWGANVGDEFKFLTVNKASCKASAALFDADGVLVDLLPQELRNSRVLHPCYVAEFSSCSHEEWNHWISSGKAGLQTFVAPVQSKKSFHSRQRLEAALPSRDRDVLAKHTYKEPTFRIDDWDFQSVIWKHWKKLSQNDDEVWLKIALRILSEKNTFWSNRDSAEVIERARNGSERAVACDGLTAAWVRKLRELPCLPDTHGFKRKPRELLRRTPETESLLEVEPFIDGSLDGQHNSALLDLLGVGNKPTGPDGVLDRLRTLAAVESPPAAEVDKWYGRLDALIDDCSTDDNDRIQDAFRTRKLILTQNGIWEGLDGVFLSADEEDVPGAEVIRPSVSGLTLWRKIGVAERPTPELAIKWLAGLPTGTPLESANLRRARALLRRHPQRIWEECRHWLNLAGEWVPTEALAWSLTMQSLVAWSHLHQWVKKQTADLQKLPAEVTNNPPFCKLATLATSMEERPQDDLLLSCKPVKKGWLTTFATELARACFDTEEETDRVRRLAHRLARTRWCATPQIRAAAYIEGKPAGTARRAEVLWLDDRLFYLDGLTRGKLAKFVPEEIVRAIDGHADIRAALAYGFERSGPDVREYLEENFRLGAALSASGATSQGAGKRSAGEDDEPVAAGGNQADQALGDSQPDEPYGASAGVEDGPGDVGEEAAGEATEAQADAAEARRKRRVPRKRMGPSIIQRYAMTRGYRKAAEDRYNHEDGSFIARTRGEMFPWEHRAANGNVIRYYWPREHCLEREPLEVPAEVWDRIDQSPETCALVLATFEGHPTEVTGSQLRALRHEGRITLFPATYRVVYGAERHR